eukprot:SAG31_NODE_599_length_13649_cov_9.930775_8_plen_73_part_00
MFIGNLNLVCLIVLNLNLDIDLQLSHRHTKLNLVRMPRRYVLFGISICHVQVPAPASLHTCDHVTAVLRSNM